MKLKRDIDYRRLLNRVKRCKKDVLLKTKEGDVLNLKSELSQYLVLFLARQNALLKDAWIECMDTADEALFAEFCEL